jgi:proline dehydrogenase
VHRTQPQIEQSLLDASQNSYALGVKLVRGAYHPYERSAHYARQSGNKASLSLSDEEKPPVWEVKSETDACYDSCVAVLVDAVKKDIDKNRRSVQEKKTDAMGGVMGVGVLFGTHNWKSCQEIVRRLVESGLARPAGQVKGQEGQGERVRLGEEVTERVAVAQLFGMSDDLTNWLVRRTVSDAPFIIKWVFFPSSFLCYLYSFESLSL